ncbi:hypothetical protein OZL92_05465 [Bacillus sonorensis]|uniref:Uncharacterized protein n=2 Tax=Bacillus sonorensis TaxID=119858 RepID=M5PHR4_9BACI|nr:MULTISPECIES: hypothetical protein [Bacillus]TWK82341.1 hypothetical protein CHCC20335_3384 [Bacillus paralicheniformis]ASB88913.1 hypothetical protein S101395_02405 [Bacillus sonorensis]EME76282.1 hypothetical protein BSONL12_00817 [Bacillus sonorensis L12]MBG9915313.1 hypothetical protein [Bacillus sonorensis]MCF7618260.1 hypothetical protein [Bacillus sonorensis]
MKRIRKAIFLGVIAASMLPTTSAFAAEVQSFGWKTLADYQATISKQGSMTGDYKSDGGNYRICVFHIRMGNTMTVSLYESDPEMPLERVGNRKLIAAPSGCATWTSLNSWIDGSNKKAEFNAKIDSETGPDAVQVKVQD